MGFAVFLIDDDSGVLKALDRLLRAAGYETKPYSSPQRFLVEHDPTAPGCVVLDFTMPEIDGLELQRRLSEEEPDRPIIFLTGTGDIPTSVTAMKAGAIDFLTKPIERRQLVEAVERARDCDEKARAVRDDQQLLAKRLSRLTPREREVLEYVVTGRMNKQIAASLGTCEKTIKVHRGRIMAKLEVRSVAELVRLTERGGMHPMH